MYKIEFLILIILLILIFVQDWKNREIHIVLPFLIFGLAFYLNTIKDGTKVLNLFYNISFFLITLFLLVAYMSVKYKKIQNPFKNYFGIGDLLFYIAVAPLFLIRSYIIYFIISLVFSIILQLILSARVAKASVPLAGFASLSLIGLLISEVYFDLIKITTI